LSASASFTKRQPIRHLPPDPLRAIPQ
jgi:hypothetical protein